MYSLFLRLCLGPFQGALLHATQLFEILLDKGGIRTQWALDAQHLILEALRAHGTARRGSAALVLVQHLARHRLLGPSLWQRILDGLAVHSNIRTALIHVRLLGSLRGCLPGCAQRE